MQLGLINRDFEIRKLDEVFASKKSEIAVLYGRRRVGKSFLIETWVKKKKNFLAVEGIEKGSQAIQIQSFSAKFLEKLDLPHIQSPKEWRAALDLMTLYLKTNKSKDKKIIFLDEFQWLCRNKSELVALIKSYWELEWKNLNILLILCGSITSFMYKKVVHSTALYGRISLELKISPFSVEETVSFLQPIRSPLEVYEYYYALGGVAKYLTLINPKKSFKENINNIYLSKSAVLQNEFLKVFYKQFKFPKVYVEIIKILREHALSFNEIVIKLGRSSGGTIKEHLFNLELADFIATYYPVHRGVTSKEKKYYLKDEFCRFYLTYIEKNKELISKNEKNNLFDKMILKNWKSYCGLGFERLIFQMSKQISEKCHFDHEVQKVGKFFPEKNHNTQFDLVYLRFDQTVTIFEVRSSSIDIHIIEEFESKLEKIKNHSAFKNKKIEKGIIFAGEIPKEIKKQKYFHYLISAKDLIKID